MFGFLVSRENGTDVPDCLPYATCSLRSQSLDLSKHYDVERLHKGGINSLDIDPVDQRYLLSGGANGMIGIHDLHSVSHVPQNTHPCVARINNENSDRHQFSVETVQWYPHDNGLFVSSGTDKKLKVWDSNNLRTADEFSFSGVVYSHALSPIATHHCLVAVGYLGNKVELLDLKSGSSTFTLIGHRQSVLSVKWSTREEFVLATGGQDSKILLWDIRSAKGSMMVLDQHNADTTASPNSVNTAHDGQVNGLCFTEDGQRLLSVGTDSRLRVWSAATGRHALINFGAVPNKRRRAVQLAISHGARPELVYVPTRDTITVRSIQNATRYDTLKGHYGVVNACIASTHTQHLYSGGADRNLLVWTPTVLAGGATALAKHLAHDESEPTKRSNFMTRIGATADTWSSDEGGSA